MTNFDKNQMQIIEIVHFTLTIPSYTTLKVIYRICTFTSHLFLPLRLVLTFDENTIYPRQNHNSEL